MHQILSANLPGTMFNVCERLVPLRAVSVHTALGSSLAHHQRRGERGGGGVTLRLLCVCWFCLFVGRLSFSRFVRASRVSRLFLVSYLAM